MKRAWLEKACQKLTYCIMFALAILVPINSYTDNFVTPLKISPTAVDYPVSINTKEVNQMDVSAILPSQIVNLNTNEADHTDPVTILPSQITITNQNEINKIDPYTSDKLKYSILLADNSRASEKERLRKRWEEFLGVDIFYLYFKLKELEDWVKERAKIKIFKMVGKPEFKKNQVIYVFKIKF